MSAGLNAQPAVIPTFAQVKQQSPHSDFLLHDKQGRLLQTQRIDWHRRQGEWLDLEAISPLYCVWYCKQKTGVSIRTAV
nr:hypothetical protein [Paenalcaligenes hominis]